MITCITGATNHPTQGLEKMIPANFDIRRDVIDERGPSAAKHDVFSCRLQFIVHYFEWSGAVPTDYGLCVLTYDVDVGNIRINHRQGCSVERNPSLDIPCGRTVNVAAVNRDVVRKLRHRS